MSTASEKFIFDATQALSELAKLGRQGDVTSQQLEQLRQKFASLSGVKGLSPDVVAVFAQLGRQVKLTSKSMKDAEGVEQTAVKATITLQHDKIKVAHELEMATRNYLRYQQQFNALVGDSSRLTGISPSVAKNVRAAEIALQQYLQTHKVTVGALRQTFSAISRNKPVAADPQLELLARQLSIVREAAREATNVRGSKLKDGQDATSTVNKLVPSQYDTVSKITGMKQRLADLALQANATSADVAKVFNAKTSGDVEGRFVQMQRAASNLRREMSQFDAKVARENARPAQVVGLREALYSRTNYQNLGVDKFLPDIQTAESRVLALASASNMTKQSFLDLWTKSISGAKENNAELFGTQRAMLKLIALDKEYTTSAQKTPLYKSNLSTIHELIQNRVSSKTNLGMGQVFDQSTLAGIGKAASDLATMTANLGFTGDKIRQVSADLKSGFMAGDANTSALAKHLASINHQLDVGTSKLHEQAAALRQQENVTLSLQRMNEMLTPMSRDTMALVSNKTQSRYDSAVVSLQRYISSQKISNEEIERAITLTREEIGSDSRVLQLQQMITRERFQANVAIKEAEKSAANLASITQREANMNQVMKMTPFAEVWRFTPEQINQLNKARNVLADLMTKYEITGQRATRMFETALAGGREYNNRAEADVQAAMVNLQRASRGVLDNYNLVGRAARQAQRLLIHVAGYQVFYMMMNTAREAVQKFNELETKISEINTISQTMPRTFQSWSEALRGLSDSWGKDIFDQTAAAYQAISNQVANSRNVVSFVDDANKLAATGISTTAQASDLLASALNSYGQGLNQTNTIAASFFKTVDLGRVVVKDIAETFGDTLVPASHLGINLNEVNAALALITQQGNKPTKAMTYLRNIMVSLTNPTQEMQKVFEEFGVTSGEQLVTKLGGLGGVLAAFADKTNMNANALDKLIRRQTGLVGVQTLARNQLQDFNNIYQELTNSVGDYDRALQIIQDTDAFKFRQASTELQNFLVMDLGGSAMKAIHAFVAEMGDIRPTIEAFTETLKIAAEAVVLTFAVSKLTPFLNSLQGIVSQTALAKIEFNALVEAQMAATGAPRKMVEQAIVNTQAQAALSAQAGRAATAVNGVAAANVAVASGANLLSPQIKALTRNFLVLGGAMAGLSLRDSILEWGEGKDNGLHRMLKSLGIDIDLAINNFEEMKSAEETLQYQTEALARSYEDLRDRAINSLSAIRANYLQFSSQPGELLTGSMKELNEALQNQSQNAKGIFERVIRTLGTQTTALQRNITKLQATAEKAKNFASDIRQSGSDLDFKFQISTEDPGKQFNALRTRMQQQLARTDFSKLNADQTSKAVKNFDQWAKQATQVREELTKKHTNLTQKLADIDVKLATAKDQGLTGRQIKALQKQRDTVSLQISRLPTLQQQGSIEVLINKYHALGAAREDAISTKASSEAAAQTKFKEKQESVIERLKQELAQQGDVMNTLDRLSAAGDEKAYQNYFDAVMVGYKDLFDQMKKYSITDTLLGGARTQPLQAFFGGLQAIGKATIEGMARKNWQTKADRIFQDIQAGTQTVAVEQSRYNSAKTGIDSITSQVPQLLSMLGSDYGKRVFKEVPVSETDAQRAWRTKNNLAAPTDFAYVKEPAIDFADKRMLAMLMQPAGSDAARLSKDPTQYKSEILALFDGIINKLKEAGAKSTDPKYAELTNLRLQFSAMKAEDLRLLDPKYRMGKDAEMTKVGKDMRDRSNAWNQQAEQLRAKGILPPEKSMAEQAIENIDKSINQLNTNTKEMLNAFGQSPTTEGYAKYFQYIREQQANILENAKNIRAVMGGAKETTPAKEYNGGPARFATGGMYGTDRVHTVLTPGEFVLNTAATRRFAGQLVGLNNQRLASGGAVSRATNVGNISINVNGNESPAVTANGVMREMRNRIRRGTFALN